MSAFRLFVSDGDFDIYTWQMVTSTSTPGSMTMEVICLTISEEDLKSMKELNVPPTSIDVTKVSFLFLYVRYLSIHVIASIPKFSFVTAMCGKFQLSKEC